MTMKRTCADVRLGNCRGRPVYERVGIATEDDHYVVEYVCWIHLPDNGDLSEAAQAALDQREAAAEYAQLESELDRLLDQMDRVWARMSAEDQNK